MGMFPLPYHSYIIYYLIKYRLDRIWTLSEQDKCNFTLGTDILKMSKPRFVPTNLQIVVNILREKPRLLKEFNMFLEDGNISFWKDPHGRVHIL